MLLGFKKQFAPMVECGDKAQTIRARRKRPFKVEDKLQLYTSLRTIWCRKLGEANCTVADDICIRREASNDEDRISITIHTPGQRIRILNKCGIKKLIRDDGFKEVFDFVYFFVPKKGDIFTGQLIKWNNFIPKDECNGKATKGKCYE